MIAMTKTLRGGGYYDQSTADLVFNMYAVDFRAFRYERFMERPLESDS